MLSPPQGSFPVQGVDIMLRDMEKHSGISHALHREERLTDNNSSLTAGENSGVRIMNGFCW